MSEPLAPSGASLAPLEALLGKWKRSGECWPDTDWVDQTDLGEVEMQGAVAQERVCARELEKILPALQTSWATLEQENQHLKAENEQLRATDRHIEECAEAILHRQVEAMQEAELTALRTQLTERSLQLCAEVEEHEATKALLSSQAHAQEQLRWREIVVDGFPLDGALVSVWRAWPGQIRDTKFLDLRMPGPSWEGLYGWEPTHWRPNLSPVEMRALLTQKEPTP